MEVMTMGLFKTEKQDPRLDEWRQRAVEAQERAYATAKAVEGALVALVEARSKMRLAEAALPELVAEGDALLREAGIEPTGPDRSLSVNTCLGGMLKFTASIPDMVLRAVDSLIMARAQAQSLERRLRADEKDRLTAERVPPQRMTYPADVYHTDVQMDLVTVRAVAGGPELPNPRPPLGWRDSGPPDLFPTSDLVRSDRLAELEAEARVLNRGGGA
jgi:hypothetical protein